MRVKLTLTPAELHDITGYWRPLGQRGWLKERAWVFECDARGRPKVLRAYAESKMGGTPEAKPAQWEPDFSDLAA